MDHCKAYYDFKDALLGAYTIWKEHSNIAVAL